MAALALTTSEAGYVLGRSPSEINKAVDAGLIRADIHGGRAGAAKSRLFGKSELLCLKIADALENDLTPLGQRKIYEAIRRQPRDAQQVRVGVLSLEIGPFERAIDERIERLMELRQRVDAIRSGEPVISGTAIPVYQIAGLAKGQTVEEIMEDYPSLSLDQVEGAIEYAKAYPKKGRPYPARSFKRMIGDLGLDEIETEPAQEGPRLIPS